ncbi:hypothetical protein chiPu_0008843 [Chiloscyllium punctatum]|uniref:Uncharacterized protein n=1 Tax=Chiloscyllium punctatum TaxID=137246 RepID=A0A401SJ19_CHIPU|nr:hypothetical protein [Chiloscyllium punctatum]
MVSNSAQAQMTFVLSRSDPHVRQLSLVHHDSKSDGAANTGLVHHRENHYRRRTDASSSLEKEEVVEPKKPRAKQ